MKISAQDEYGLRILLRIARAEDQEGMTIVQLSELEGLSQPYVAKITRILRMANLIESTKGRKGGYILAKPPGEIKVSEILNALGGTLFDSSFCKSHSGQGKICTNSLDCSVRSLWQIMQASMDSLLNSISLDDLIGKELRTSQSLQHLAVQLAITPQVPDER
ncbi:MAG: Rrf2 family transcriptional regulator [Saprospiraceae bacterium]|nr:Rrf2 family transcriptional regulator [Saprospiraceae bacterium]